LMIFPNLKFRGVEDNGITVPILIIVLLILPHPLPGASLLLSGQSVYGQDKSLPYVPVTQGGNRTGGNRQNRARPGFGDSQPRPRGSGPRIRGHEDSRPCITPTRHGPGNECRLAVLLSLFIFFQTIEFRRFESRSLRQAALLHFAINGLTGSPGTPMNSNFTSI